MIDQAAPQPLPAPLDGFVGRDQEVAAAVRLATSASVRLLTLVGPGGVGKTRLALRVAAETTASFPDGVVFAPLAELHDPDLIPSAVAQALGLRGAAGQSLDRIIHEQLVTRRLLLVLDNLEQLLPAAGAQVATLLLACPDLTVLATSRALLRVTGEHAFPVLPLDVPPSSQHELDGIKRSASVQLLLARGQALRPDLRLTEENAAAIAAICRQLDGLPLALELAAAWLRIFSPTALLSRLEQRLTLLVDGPVDQPQRHGTMRAAIGWSYDLLAPSEQRLFRQLAVFAGGWTLEVVESIANAEARAPLALLEGVTALCDASLVHRIDDSGEEPRFTMLETIRDYAREQLNLAEEQHVVQRAHAAHFFTMADRASRDLLGPAHGTSFDRLETEHDNLRAALAWSIDHEPLRALLLAGSLAAFWGNRGHLEEGGRWYERVLAHGSDAPPGPRAAALIGSAWLTWSRGDYDRAEQAAVEGLALAVAADGRDEPVLLALYLLGRIAGSQGRLNVATERLEDALTRCRAVGNAFGEAVTLHHLGVAAYRQGDLMRAERLLEDAIVLNRDLGLPRGLAWTLNSLSVLMRSRGDDRRARSLYRESLGILGDNDETYAAIPLAGLARLAAGSGEFAAAARIATAVACRRDLIGAPVWEQMESDLARALDISRNGLGEPFAAIQIAAETDSLATTIAHALAIPDPPPSRPRQAILDELTPRERDVLTLLATGCSNQAIADQLGIRLVTAKTHVASILAKLGVSTRAAATSYAIRHGMADPQIPTK